MEQLDNVLQKEIRDLQLGIVELQKSKQDKLPLASVIALFLWVVGSTISGVWWASSINENVVNLTKGLEQAAEDRYYGRDATSDFALRDQMLDWIAEELRDLEARTRRLEGNKLPYTEEEKNAN